MSQQNNHFSATQNQFAEGVRVNGEQVPLLDDTLGHDPNEFLKDKSKFWSPMIKCEPCKAGVILCANLFLNPLGTFIGVIFDENGFNIHMLAIGILQLLCLHFLRKIPLLGGLMSIPNWILGIVIAARIFYYNYIRIQGLKEMGKRVKDKGDLEVNNQVI